ncbi:MAG: metallophosphoesterase [Candidatus Babeliales bacterium]
MVLFSLNTLACDYTYQTFDELKNRYESLPLAVTLKPEESGFYYDEASKQETEDFVYTKKGIEKDTFLATVHQFKVVMRNQLEMGSWCSGHRLDLTATLEQGKKHPYYLEKCVVTDDEKLFFIGDLHGDVHAFIREMEKLSEEGYLDKDDPLKIKENQKIRIIIQGDCNDKGLYSAELWDMIMRYKIQNPDRFIIIRGNHEDQIFKGAFEQELADKFKMTGRLERHTFIQDLNALLPVALFIGKHDRFNNHIDYSLFSHAGLELGWAGYDALLNSTQPHLYQTLDTLDRATQATKLPKDIKQILQQKINDTGSSFKNEFVPVNLRSTRNSSPVGFMWNFYTDDAKSTFNYQEGSSWIYGQKLFNAVIGLWSNYNALPWHQKMWRWTNSYLRHWGIKKWELPTTYTTVTNIRSHQHAAMPEIGQFPEMCTLIENKGLYKHWSKILATHPYLYRYDRMKRTHDISVTYPSAFTTLCAPSNAYGYPYRANQIKRANGEQVFPHAPDTHYLQLFNFATIGALTLADSYKKWKIDSYAVDVFQQKDVLNMLPQGSAFQSPYIVEKIE